MKKISDKLFNFENQFKKTFLSEKFHKETKRTSRVKIPALKDTPKPWITIDFKSYPRFPSYFLPIISSKKINKPYGTVLKNRKSIRLYDNNKTLSAKTFSTLLYHSAGINRRIGENWDTSTRFYPSSGARYPLEVYIVIFGKSDLPNGIYHYFVKSHCLEFLREGNYKNEVIDSLGNFNGTQSASAAIYISAIFQRNQVKYDDRGYRHILTENGALIQTIYLTCAALGLGCCAQAGFLDDKINKLLDLDGQMESVIGVLIVGNKKIERR